MFVIYLLALINLTGFPWVAWSGSTWGGNEFGWPFRYLSAPLTEAQWDEAIEFRCYLQDHKPYKGFITPLASPWGHQVEEFRPWRLMMNVAAAALLAGAVVAAMGLRQRFRRRPLQFTVRYLLVLVTLGAAVAAILRSGDVILFYWNHRLTLYLVAFCVGAILLVGLVLKDRAANKA